MSSKKTAQQASKQSKQTAKQSPKKAPNLLPLLAVLVVAAAAVIVVLPRGGSGAASAAPQAADQAAAGDDIVIETAAIGAEASFYDYDAGGTTVELLAVQASDGTVRLALNTCQTCNGSPYAFYVQDGDAFVCQNCGNRFSSTMIGQSRGGCNPVPIPEDSVTVMDDTITVSAAFLEESASLFTHWMDF